MTTEIVTIPILSDNYAYLLIQDGHALVVDPGHAKPIKKVLAERDLKVDGILITHEDHDHIGGIRALVDHYACPVYAPELDEIPHVTHPVVGGDVVPLLGHQIQVLSTPGHREFDLSFYIQDLYSLFCGDVLFTGGCGRCRTNSPTTFWKSLQTINRLPGATKIYCGHEYALENYQFAAELTTLHVFVERLDWARENLCSVPTTLEEERRSNIFLRSADPALMDLCGLAGKEPWEVFEYLRAEKDRF